MTNPKEDLSGRKYGRLLVIKQADDYVYPNGKRRTCWECLCDCGNTVIVEQSNLKSGNSNSCGCLDYELKLTRSITHGDRHSKLYGIWTNMKTRCNNPNNTSYKDYGERGIAVCKEWDDSYEAFKDWAIKSGYSKETDSYYCSLDRIDVNKGYYPDNCRWVSMKKQANNRRNTIMIAYNGETKSLSEWADTFHIKYHTLFARLYKLGWTFDEAIQKH